MSSFLRRFLRHLFKALPQLLEMPIQCLHLQIRAISIVPISILRKLRPPVAPVAPDAKFCALHCLNLVLPRLWLNGILIVSLDQNKVPGSIPGWSKKISKFPFLQIHDVHQFDHMDCEFFQKSLWIAASGKNRLLSYLKSSREFLDSLPADYDKSSQRTRDI